MILLGQFRKHKRYDLIIKIVAKRLSGDYDIVVVYRGPQDKSNENWVPGYTDRINDSDLKYSWPIDTTDLRKKK